MRLFQASRAPAEEPVPVLFVHVMKTGGTTVHRHLRATYALEQIYPYRPLDVATDAEGAVDPEQHLSVPYLLSLSPERRSTIRVYSGHFPYVVRDLLGFPVRAATVLRDPVERTISMLRQLRRNQPWEEEVGRAPQADRELEDLYEDPDVFGPLLHEHQTKVFSLAPEDHPYAYTDVVPMDAARLARAKRNLAEVEVLGTTERFTEFLLEAERAFGWSVAPGARKNVTPDAELTPVSASFRKRIAADNALDVELYEHVRTMVEARR